jgi:kynurenine formamidase
MEVHNTQTRRDAIKVLGGLGIGYAAQAAFGAEGPPAPEELTKAEIEKMMSTLSNWGRWGDDDQLGALNLITPEKRRQAAALVKEGAVVSLAAEAVSGRDGPTAPFVQRMMGMPRPGVEIASSADEYRVRYHGFTLTHLDALCHLCFQGRMYNGFSADEVGAEGAKKLDVGQVKDGIFTRGVLMDMPRLLGVRFLEGAYAIYPRDLEAWERKCGMRVESGDALLLRTGCWMRRRISGEWNVMQGSAGLHASCLPWLKERDVALVGSDLALDVMPSGVEGFELPVHWVSVVAMGMPILDNCDLEPLGERADKLGRWTFLLAVAPWAVQGGTGSPVNPLATF